MRAAYLLAEAELVGKPIGGLPPGDATMKTKFALIPAFFAAATFGTAFAQNVPADPDADENSQDGRTATEETTDDAPINDGTLPAPQSDDDPHPEVAAPGVPPGGLVEQAGIGGKIGY